MTTEITKFDIENDMDLVLAHRRAMQLGKFGGIGLSEQTRFATSVSEICRNCLEYAQKGSIQFYVRKDKEQHFVGAHIKDKGKGIKNLEAVLSRTPQSFKGRGIGIAFAKKLADKFKITSGEEGTQVWIEKFVSGKIPINNLILKGWIQHIKDEPSISPYEELKERNNQLLQLTEELTTERNKVSDHSEEIQKLNEKLARSNEDMKQFTYAISHDLRTPLTSLNMAFTFVEELAMNEELKTYFQIILRSGKRLNSTINSLIEVLDVQNSSTGLAKKLALPEAFLEVYDDFTEKIIDKKGSVKYNFDDTPEVIYIEAYLKSIFTNLLSNSIKYSVPDRPLAINVSSRRSSNKVIIEFSDNGHGIDLEKNGHMLFVPFTRFSLDTQGKGIGLYIIKNMVERNGGKIEVKSQPGEGTSFKFILPEYPL